MWEAGTDVHEGVMLDSRISPQITQNDGHSDVFKCLFAREKVQNMWMWNKVFFPQTR